MDTQGLGKLVAFGLITAGSGWPSIFGAALEFVGVLGTMGVPQTATPKFAAHLKNGGTLLTVLCGGTDQVRRATQILQNTNEAAPQTDELYFLAYGPVLH